MGILIIITKSNWNLMAYILGIFKKNVKYFEMKNNRVKQHVRLKRLGCGSAAYSCVPSEEEQIIHKMGKRLRELYGLQQFVPANTGAQTLVKGFAN